MASLELVLPFVRKEEGGYVNNPKDKGKETYCGISRKHHPEWEGWPIVDQQKLRKKLKWNQVIDNPVLEHLVNEFYKKQYWQKEILGDLINSQLVAGFLMDWQVHSGDRATKTVQTILGLKPDGAFGPKTLAAVNVANEQWLYRRLFAERREFYMRNVLAEPDNAEFLRNWLGRTERYHKQFASLISI